MATNEITTAATDAELRKEFAELKKQVSTLTDLLKKKGEEESAIVKHNIERGYENVKEKAKEHLHNAQEAGAEGIEKVGGKVKENPFSSLLLAFGMGYLISKSFKKDD